MDADRSAWLARALVALVGLIVGASGTAEAGRRPALPGPIPAQADAVIDGDTLRVRARIWLDQEVDTIVRLEGIDAPELDGSCGSERELAARARDRLAELIGDGVIALLQVRHDKYGGRVLATVTDARGRDVGAALVRAGLARAYQGGARVSWCPIE